MLYIHTTGKAKKSARFLEKFLHTLGIDLKHGQALDALAGLAGHADWNSWAASFSLAAVNASLGEGELSHAEATADAEYGDECVLLAHSGFTLRCPAFPADCEYVRICDPHGRETAYWAAEEWATDPAEVMGAVVGALVRDTPVAMTPAAVVPAAPVPALANTPTGVAREVLEPLLAEYRQGLEALDEATQGCDWEAENPAYARALQTVRRCLLRLEDLVHVAKLSPPGLPVPRLYQVEVHAEGEGESTWLGTWVGLASDDLTARRVAVAELWDARLDASGATANTALRRLADGELAPYRVETSDQAPEDAEYPVVLAAVAAAKMAQLLGRYRGDNRPVRVWGRNRTAIDFSQVKP